MAKRKKRIRPVVGLIAAAVVLAAVSAGCASSDRMVRMSGGVFDEYSAPKSSRIRSEKYQKVSRSLDADTRANRDDISGLDDTLVNLWPFFFRTSAYWSVLWPMVDCDPYGFAFRPFYNHEGDDYSILFPLSAWNPSEHSGWVTLFAWVTDGFGFIPLTWQTNGTNTGFGYYTPLCIWDYDSTQVHYTRWFGNEFGLFLFPVYTGHKTRVQRDGEWEWLFNAEYPNIRNEWIYRFGGKKPFPAKKVDFEKFRAEVFSGLPRIEERTRALLPLWWGKWSGDGDYMHRFLLITGAERNEEDFNWDILWGLLARYENDVTPARYHGATTAERSFAAWALMSYFSAEDQRHRDPMWPKLRELDSLACVSKPFNQQLPVIRDALKKIDPALELPATVVDYTTYRIFVNELWQKHRFSEETEYFGTCAPLFWYNITPEFSRWILPPLLTWWKSSDEKDGSSYFYSIPLLTFLDRSPEEDSSVVLSHLGYYAKTVRRERRDHPIKAYRDKEVSEYDCVELRDRYALCGLFYRGRFGYNAAKPGVDVVKAEHLRQALARMPGEWRQLEKRRLDLDKQSSQNDRWQTQGEIERLKKLIRIEEIRIAREKLAVDTAAWRKFADEALADASSLGLGVTAETLADADKARAAADQLIEKCTDLCFYEDIGHNLLFHKMNFANGDSSWHLLHFLASGEKSGDRESTNVLHLLYRFRREGNRSETVCFPFIVSREDGDDSSFSFMWRVFERKTRGGRTSGHILFIPFGEE